MWKTYKSTKLKPYTINWIINFLTYRKQRVVVDGTVTEFVAKQPLILQIVHAAFDPLGVRQHFPCDSNF
jgi:hypothetical protein